jgi:hypothetical protein
MHMQAVLALTLLSLLCCVNAIHNTAEKDHRALLSARRLGTTHLHILTSGKCIMPKEDDENYLADDLIYIMNQARCAEVTKAFVSN